jgi:hypothetical protein
VSTIWTPSGEHRPEPDDQGTPSGLIGGTPVGGPVAGDAMTADEAAMAEELARMSEELVLAPVADVVANHAVGLWQLAILHLAAAGAAKAGQPAPLDADAHLDRAGLAIDAFGALVDGLGARLAPHDEALRDALAQLRLTYVEARA